MSGRYSNSPALRLRIDNTGYRRALYLALCCSTCFALALLYRDGYTWLVLSLLPPVVSLLWRLRRPAISAVDLCWRQGIWTLESADYCRLIIPGSRCIVLPWVIYLPFTVLPGARKECLWLFVDGVPCEHWRQLRARLNLDARQSTPPVLR